MNLIYCGVVPIKEYPGTQVSTLAEAISAFKAEAWDVILWSWSLGKPPREMLPGGAALILICSEESLELYRTALERGCRHVLVSSGSQALAAEIEETWEEVQEQRRGDSYRSLFQKYGDHLKIHMWYDLIVEGRYKDLLEPMPYRLMLLYAAGLPEEKTKGVPRQKVDGPTIISGVFPEAIAILALQHPWECVVLPGDVRRLSERAAQCQTLLRQRLGEERKFWLSPPLLPDEVHGFYQQILVDTVRREEQSVSSMVCSYIQDHLGEKLTRKTISDNLFFSPDYLAKVFLAETGITMGAYLCGARLERAKEQLVQTSLPIGTIAAELGYQNFSEFSQWFKKQTGMVPSRYRKEKT